MIQAYELNADHIECSICLNSKPNLVLPCMHPFCEECVTDWYVKNESCPLCRKKDNLNGYFLVDKVSHSLLKALIQS